MVGVEINPLMVAAGHESLQGYFEDFYADGVHEEHYRTDLLA